MSHSIDTNPVKKASSGAGENDLIEEMRALKTLRSLRSSRVAKAVQILQQTNSARVRNAAALALADLRAHDAKDALIESLTKPDTKGARGTLLYALEQLGADTPLPILADIVIDEAYEAREEALGLMARNRFESSAGEFTQARAKLEDALVSADDERSEAIRRALQFLRRRSNSKRRP